jgi:hypothetical protein
VAAPADVNGYEGAAARSLADFNRMLEKGHPRERAYN